MASARPVLDRPIAPTAKQEAFLSAHTMDTPFVVVDLDVVGERYDALVEALGEADIFYAVKANPAAAILALLVERGASFDVASRNEIEMVLAAGADPSRISFGNTIKKAKDIQWAYAQGVRLFAFDAEQELEKLMQHAPGATRTCPGRHTGSASSSGIRGSMSTS